MYKIVNKRIFSCTLKPDIGNKKVQMFGAELAADRRKELP